MSAYMKDFDRGDPPGQYKKGDKVLLRGANGVDPKPYKIHAVLFDGQYRLSRDRRLDGRVFLEEDFEPAPSSEVGRRKRSPDQIPPRHKAISFAQTSPRKANVDEDRLQSYHVKAEHDVHNSGESVAPIAEPSTKPIKQETGELDRRMIYKIDSDGPEVPWAGINLENATLELAGGLKNLENATLEWAEDLKLATNEAKELEDTGASFSERDVSEIPEEVNGGDDRPSRRHSREKVKWQNLRSVLSKFGIGERPLAEAKKRVRWKCGCGRNFYDDFTELRSGAAAELEKWLNDSMKKHAGSSPSSRQHGATTTSSASPNTGSSENRQTVESDISLQPLAQTANTQLASDRNAAVVLDVRLEKCWLILCGNMKRGPDALLTQLDLSSTPSDRSLFDEMKGVYSNLKKRWTLRSVLRGVKTIRFVQFQLHKSARVDIRKAPDMPPLTRRDEYLYEPCDLIPPVGETFMTHWFHHPEEAWELPWAYSLFPKRRKGELEVNLNHAPSVGWGIYIVEGWLGSRLWLLSLSLFLCGSLAFAICWTILKHDIQGAFGVSAYVVALLTLVVGAAQANFE